MKQFTPEEEEAYVWARWIFVISCPYGEIVISNSGSPVPFDNMHEAYLFTKQRKAEIEEIEEEIDLVHGMEGLTKIGAQCQPALASTVRIWNAWKRNLSARQAALAELRHGMKEQG